MSGWRPKAKKSPRDRAREHAHRQMTPGDPEHLIVYGANCVWWDGIEKASTKKTARMTGPGLPCCPHCGSVLMQVEEPKWWINTDEHEAKGNPGYRKLIEWMQGRCFPTMSKAREAYEASGAGAVS